MGLWIVEVPTVSRQSDHRWRWGCRPYAPTGRHLPPRRFLVLISVKIESNQGHSAAESIRSIEKSNDLIENRTRDLPACSIMRQPTTLQRASNFHFLIWTKFCLFWCPFCIQVCSDYVCRVLFCDFKFIPSQQREWNSTSYLTQFLHMKRSIFYDITLSSPVKFNRNFTSPPVQSWRVGQERNHHETGSKPWTCRRRIPPKRRFCRATIGVLYLCSWAHRLHCIQNATCALRAPLARAALSAARAHSSSHQGRHERGPGE
jgi:hypothetical protein